MVGGCFDGGFGFEEAGASGSVVHFGVRFFFYFGIGGLQVDYDATRSRFNIDTREEY